MSVDTPYEVVFFCEGLGQAELPIRVGPVTFRWSTLEAPPQVIEMLRKVFGESFREEWLEKGFPAAHVGATAVDSAEAVKGASRQVDVAVDALRLKEPPSGSGFHIGLPKTARALPAVLVIEKGLQPSLAPMAYIRDQIGTMVVGDLADPTPQLNAKLSSAVLDRLPEELFSSEGNGAGEIVQRIRRALHWMGVARPTEDPASRFIMMWTALESLVGCPQDGRGRKGELIKGRLNALCASHGADVPDGQLIDRLWRLRCEVFHEAAMGYFDPGATLGVDVTVDLRAVQLLLYQALLYLLDVHGFHGSLRAAWDAIGEYTPDTHIDLNDIPLFFRFIDAVGQLA